MMRLRPLRLPAMLLAMLLVLPQFALSAVPQLLNFQGVLKNNGVPVPNGSHTVTFAIYDAPSGGTVLWTETQSVITNTGHFAVLLGSVTPIPNNVLKGTSKYLGITVPPDPELSPRQQLVSVASSYQVGTIDGATGGTINGSLEVVDPSPIEGRIELGNGTGYSNSKKVFLAMRPTNNFAQLAAYDYQANTGMNLALNPEGGNVGIGTNNPAAPFVVSNHGATGLEFYDSGNIGGGPGGYIQCYDRISSGYGELGFNASDHKFFIAGSERMIVKNNGNVGIGDPNPTQRLHVAGNVFATGTFISADVHSGFVRLGPSPGSWGSNWRLGVDGNIGACGSIVGDLFCSPSDGRYKTDVEPLGCVLDKLESVHGVRFHWNDRFRSKRQRPVGRQIGVIAQDVEREFPELVFTADDGYKAVDYGKLSAVLLEAIKEQQKEIEALKEAVAKIRDERK